MIQSVFGRRQSFSVLVYKMPRSGCRSVLHSDCTDVIVEVMYMCDELKARFSFYFSRCMSRKHIVTFVCVNSVDRDTVRFSC